MKDSLLTDVATYDSVANVVSQRVSGTRSRLLHLTIMAAIGGFLFGYDTGVVSGAMLLIKDDFDLTAAQQEIVVTSTVVFCAIFSLLGGPINNKYGRRPTLLLASAIFTLGALTMGFAPSYPVLVLGRLIIGAGIGLASLTTPMYIAEMAPMRLRGSLVTVNVLCIAGGQFVAGMVDGLLANHPYGWRLMLGLAAVPAVIMLVGFIPLPESPRWLVQNGQREAGLKILKRFRDTDAEAEQEVTAIVDGLIAHEALCASTKLTAWQHPPTRRALILGCGLMFLQQFAGINTVMYYAASIYEMAGYSKNASIWLSGFTALAQVSSEAEAALFAALEQRLPLCETQVRGVWLTHVCPPPRWPASASASFWSSERAAERSCCTP